MNIPNELFQAILSLLVGLLAFLASFSQLIDSAAFLNLFRRILGKEVISPERQSYSNQLARLVENLNNSSKEVDKLLQEFTTIATDRSEAISKLEQEITAMEERETQLKIRLEALEQVSPEAVEHFAALIEGGEKRSAFRDYALFFLGVVVSTIIAIILSSIGLG